MKVTQKTENVMCVRPVQADKTGKNGPVVLDGQVVLKPNEPQNVGPEYEWVFTESPFMRKMQDAGLLVVETKARTATVKKV